MRDEDGFIYKMVMGALRQGLGIVAGSLVAKGYLDASHADAGIGAILALAAIGWSLYDKHRVAKMVKAKNEIIASQHETILDKTAEINSLK